VAISSLKRQLRPLKFSSILNKTSGVKFVKILLLKEKRLVLLYFSRLWVIYSTAPFVCTANKIIVIAFINSIGAKTVLTRLCFYLLHSQLCNYKIEAYSNQLSFTLITRSYYCLQTAVKIALFLCNQ
jgi:hypothetical protein